VLTTSAVVPPEWRIEGTDWAVILPLGVVAGCHVLFPVSVVCVFFFWRG
jgi:hypothetical protein